MGAEEKIAPQRHDIYLVRWRFRLSFDVRPCIILEKLSNHEFKIALISAQLDLARQNFDFSITADHPDFGATGLKKFSFVLGDQIHDVPLEALGKRLGLLQSDLKHEFEEWIG